MDVTHYEVAITGGYVWYPLHDRGLFVQFWGSVGRYIEGRDARVGDRTFDQPPVQPYLTLHLGFEI